MIGSMSNLVSISNDFGYYMWETLTGFKASSMQALHENKAVIGYVKKYSENRFDEAVDGQITHYVRLIL